MDSIPYFACPYWGAKPSMVVLLYLIKLERRFPTMFVKGQEDKE
jgi:hypothetical protein